MLALFHKTECDMLLMEIKRESIKKFSVNTQNRLKNEDPEYAKLIEILACKFSKKLGRGGYELALELGAIYHRARELAEKSQSKLLAPMHHEALKALEREINAMGFEQFTLKILGGVRKRDFEYIKLVDHIVKLYESSLGTPGAADAGFMGAVCYRACELADQYKGHTLQYQTIVDNPIPSQSAINEAEALLNMVMLRSRFHPK